MLIEVPQAISIKMGVLMEIIRDYLVLVIQEEQLDLAEVSHKDSMLINSLTSMVEWAVESVVVLAVVESVEEESDLLALVLIHIRTSINQIIRRIVRAHKEV